MKLRIIVLGILIGVFAYLVPVAAQEEAITEEDEEVIQILGILENLDVLESDLELLEYLTEVGDDNEE